MCFDLTIHYINTRIMAVESFPSALLFFFSSLGILNGILLCLMSQAWFTSRLLSVLFTALFATITVRVGKTVAMYFVPELSLWIIQIGLMACTFIGPLLYLFTLCFVKNGLRNLDYVHILAPVIVTSIIGLLFPFSAYPDVWRNAHKVIYHYWLIYIGLTFYIARGEIRLKGLKTPHVANPEFVVLNILVGNFLIWLSYYTFQYTSKIAGAVTFSVISYILVLLVFNRVMTARLKVKNETKTDIEEHKLPDGDIADFEGRIQQVMLAEKQFLHSDFSMPKAARLLKTTPHRLSFYLNNVLGTRFSDWVNDYRIDQAKALLLTSKHQNIENIAERCGYNPTSNFYSAFKKATNMTPTAFRKAHSET